MNMTLEQWREERRRSVAKPQGDLALTGLHLIMAKGAVPGIPGVWEPLAQGQPGLLLTAEAADGLTWDATGQPVEGTVKLEAEREIVRVSDSVTVMATEQPGSDHLLAVYDANAEAVQKYAGISFYPNNPDWIIGGEFAEADKQTAAFAHVGDAEGKVRHHRSPGVIRFEYGGEFYALTPFASGEALIVVFGDRTNGEETYGLGRMLLIEPDAEGNVQLDFNRAFLPSCAFSHHFNCPLPPAGNRLPFRVEAGEQQVIFGS
ncbi:DUF1684 domain-containing protein [Paenibacillus protaetiae]|uniref:DUF1684 domain-containing protein n=1 Tax=Paenibacillus protaetiae TaxID=2509456 RepID=A0A4V0YFJ6_9BACL|nr:DUF1684 domain-containing protein [Paenibacillus protaetiae]QAY67941.1 DUF1684 domain-containing protein [Paenibacillus protaetiae]